MVARAQHLLNIRDKSNMVRQTVRRASLLPPPLPSSQPGRARPATAPPVDLTTPMHHGRRGSADSTQTLAMPSPSPTLPGKRVKRPVLPAHASAAPRDRSPGRHPFLPARLLSF